MIRRWNFEHYWSGVFRVEERHEVNRVGVRGEGLVLPVKETRPVDDPVTTLACLSVMDHRLVHAVEVDRRGPPDDSLDGTSQQRAPGKISGGNAL